MQNTLKKKQLACEYLASTTSSVLVCNLLQVCFPLPLHPSRAAVGPVITFLSSMVVSMCSRRHIAAFKTLCRPIFLQGVRSKNRIAKGSAVVKELSVLLQCLLSCSRLLDADGYTSLFLCRRHC